MIQVAFCWLFSLALFQSAWGLERAGDTSALPSAGVDAVFNGSDARYVVTVEAAGARCAVPADFDDDGDMDLVSVSSNDNTVAWYEQLEDGTFGPKRMISRASNGARIVTTGDIDQDGKIDVIVASYYDHTVGWFRNEGGSFGPMNMVSRSANSAQGVSVADLDNDGDLDILSASSGDNTVAWYENLGGGTFCEVRNVVDAQSMGIRTVVAADIDEDGDMDMAVASKDDNRVTWYENDGSMNFQKHVIDDQAGGSYSLVITDIDKDGHLDIVGAANAEGRDVSGEGEGGKINFYRGDGNGNFVKIGVTGANDYDWFALSVWAGDLDGDGDDDIASASFALLHQGSISWYENIDGNGNNWTRHQVYITPSSKTGHYVFGADMDGDSDMDLIAVTNGDNKVQILYAHTQCDDSKANPRSQCCTAEQIWNGTHCASCALGTFKDDSSGSAVCSPCDSTCPRQGLSYLPNSCWSMQGCYDAAADMVRCDCGANHFLNVDLSVCQSCPDGMITLNDRDRLPADHNMVARQFLDRTTYMISDLRWQGFNSSRCVIPVCPGGNFFNMVTKDCRPCPAGEFSQGGSVTQCLECTAGHMCPLGTSTPIACQAGSYSSSGQATCTESPKGKICAFARLPAPTPCTPGSYAASEGLHECTACPLGRYAPANQSGTESCLYCPSGTTTAIAGAKSVSECFCVRGTFHPCRGAECNADFTNASSAPDFCMPCPAGAVCEGPPESPNAMTTSDGHHRPPLVPSGFMSIETSVYKCGVEAKMCPGAFMFSPVNEMCDHDGEGVACASCPDGTYWEGRQCQSCGDHSYLPLTVFLLFLCFGSGVFIYYWNNKAGKVEAFESVLASVTIGVTVSFMQALGVFNRLSFDWPVEVKFVFDFMNLMIFDTRILKLGCVFGEGLAGKFVSSFLMPIVALVVFSSWYPVSICLNKLSRGRFAVFQIDAIGNALGMILQAFYISIVLSVASAFDCFSSPNGEHQLRISPSDVCWTSEHTPIIIMASVAAVLYVVGFFVALLWVVIQAPVRVVDKRFAMCFRFVFFKYNPSVYWFGLPLMVRSVIISMVNVISPNDGYIQFLLMLFALVIFGFWHLTCMPYSDRYANMLETGEMGLLIIILGIGSWFMAREDGTSNADDEPDKAKVLSGILVALLILCVLMVACVFAYAFNQAAYPIKAREKLQAQLMPLLPGIRAAGVVLQGIDSEHLLKLLHHATYLDIGCLINTVDYISVEVGGVQPSSMFFRSRLPRMTSEVQKFDSKEDTTNKLVKKISKLGLGDEDVLMEKVKSGNNIRNSESDDMVPTNEQFVEVGC